MYNGMMATEITETSAKAKYALGEIRTITDRNGTVSYKYVKNVDVVAGAQGTVLQRKTGTTGGGSGILCVTAKCPKTRILGIVVATSLAAGYYGWVAIHGNVYCLTDAVASDDPIMADGTSGMVETDAITTVEDALAVFGTCLVTNASSATLTLCNISLF